MIDALRPHPASLNHCTRNVGLTEFVYTTPTGLVYDVRPEVFIRHEGVTCSLPVPRLN